MRPERSGLILCNIINPAGIPGGGFTNCGFELTVA
jgi:hypothetical protein